MESVRESFVLHSWPDKRETGGFLGKMKPETVHRLDRIWDRDGDKKVADHVKECRRCGRYFSPGTSHQQLLTHARKCELRMAVMPAAKRARMENGYGDTFTHNSMGRAAMMAQIPEPIGHIDEHSSDPLQQRLNALSRKEHQVYQLAKAKEVDEPMSAAYARTLAYLRVIQTGIGDIFQQQHACLTVTDAVHVQDKDPGPVPGQFVVPPVIGSVLTAPH
ncbi:hypothetical protein J8273_6262 [Carpediemonas membranifera]|uniref:Uncharacterized protein n=1 Tax=Carpediemonas membranifera TaxID=201153 RepID=A0A8J6AU11_9EUKA|nr:hypothetical protein J8273_6262 [Carpediemonas membranifera]|eukprot:KAG9391500.1 hypothetical protein J8273_6262 [Carpediemonas membranifera]